jgi:hypothetical protein
VFRSDVTVIIATHPGREVLTAEAISSVLNQDHPPDALIVEYDRHRTGAAATRNRALRGVRTHWVAFLDSDDLLLPFHLSMCLAELEKTGADLVYPGFIAQGGPDRTATARDGQVVRPFGVPFGPEQERWFRTRGGFIPVTHVCRTDRVKRAGGFPEQGKFKVPAGNVSGDCEDYGMLLAMLDRGARFAHLPARTWIYRFHEGNTGGRKGTPLASPHTAG